MAYYVLHNAAKACLYGLKVSKNIEIKHIFQSKLLFHYSNFLHRRCLNAFKVLYDNFLPPAHLNTRTSTLTLTQQKIFIYGIPLSLNFFIDNVNNYGRCFQQVFANKLGLIKPLLIDTYCSVLHQPPAPSQILKIQQLLTCSYK